MDNDYIKQAKDLVNKAVAARKNLTREEIEDVRIEISVVRLHIVTDILMQASSQRSAAELKMDHTEGMEFNKFYKISLDKKADSGKNLYTASVAESIARKAMKHEGTRYYKAKKEWLEAKDYESNMYQLVKALDQVANALSAISKV